ncbi:MAG: DNA polymerase III subunit gamma/tau [Woeseia sp.]|nr:DNA polymerase III subunit gamma/tau [Woeseia sp.]NNE60843.1 DNA polymerase III subunit gamma/tau [Woeseia sp.]NNL54499.1 DNA polymerase III subunit gamma/tau [Woeseia sp.]
MSYLVLARKWRPKNFKETVGQTHVLRALTNALEQERLHHAYLFAGTRGVGKTTIARILAKCLNCEKGVTAEPCGSCSACNEIDEGRFVDLIEVDAASKTKVDDTRDMLDNVQYAPARGRFKVYLIDEVHMLSKSSFNALLKTLEEPPPHVKFLLATTDPQKLPVTVLSRCLQFNLKRLTPKLIRDRLEFICKEEAVTIDEGSLALIARAADGSLRDALSLLDQAIAYCGGAVDGESVGTMLGTIDRRHVGRLLSLLADGDAAGLLATIAEIDEQFPDYGNLLDDIARILQRIAIWQVVGSSDANDELDEAELQRFADAISPEDVQLWYQIAIVGRRDLHMAPDPRSGMEMTALRMLAFQPAAAASSGSGKNVAQTAPPTKSRPAKSAAAPRAREKKAAAPDTGSQWQDPDWQSLIESLDLSGAVRLLANNCGYLRREGVVIYLSLDQRSESLLTKARQEQLAKSLSKRFAEVLRVDIAVGATEVETPLQAEARALDEQLSAARKSLESDPNVRALQDMFGATLNSDSIEVVHPEQSRNQEH